jgi:hypothetical protein
VTSLTTPAKRNQGFLPDVRGKPKYREPDICPGRDGNTGSPIGCAVIKLVLRRRVWFTYKKSFFIKGGRFGRNKQPETKVIKYSWLRLREHS